MVDRNEILSLVNELFGRPQGTLKGDESLEDLEWDSIKVLEFIVLLDDRAGCTVVPDALDVCRTVNDLVALVGDQVRA